MMIRRFIITLLMVALLGLVRAEDVKELLVASAQELKGAKAKTIIWKKDGAKMVRIPTISFKQVKTFNQTGNPVSFYMDINEVTVGRFKGFIY